MRRAAAQNRVPKDDTEHEFKKFTVGKDPLEKEEQIDVIEPRDAEETKTFKKMINKMILASQNTVEKNALQVYLANMDADSVKGHVKKDFARDFVAWYRGTGKEADHEKTWWYRQSLLMDPEIRAYDDAFLTKRHNYMLKLHLMKERAPVGIKEAYLYFKYIVRGEPLNDVNFLHDRVLFEKEFWEARATPGAPEVEHAWQPGKRHEMAPWSDFTRKKIADEKEKKEEDEPVIDDSSSGDEKGDLGPGGKPGGMDDEDSTSEDIPGDDEPKTPEELNKAIIDKLSQLQNARGPPPGPPPPPSPAASAPGVPLVVPEAAQQPYDSGNLGVQVERANRRVREAEEALARKDEEISTIRKRYQLMEEEKNQQQVAERDQRQDLRNLKLHDEQMKLQMEAKKHFEEQAARLEKVYAEREREREVNFERAMQGERAAMAQTVTAMTQRTNDLLEQMQRGHVNDVQVAQREIQTLQSHIQQMQANQANLNQRQKQDLAKNQQKVGFLEKVANAATEKGGNFEHAFEVARERERVRVTEEQKQLREKARAEKIATSTVIAENVKFLEPKLAREVVQVARRAEEIQYEAQEIMIEAETDLEILSAMPGRFGEVEAEVESVKPAKKKTVKIVKKAKKKLAVRQKAVVVAEKRIRNEVMEAEELAVLANSQETVAEVGTFTSDPQILQQEMQQTKKSLAVQEEAVVESQQELENAHQQLAQTQEHVIEQVAVAKEQEKESLRIAHSLTVMEMEEVEISVAQSEQTRLEIRKREALIARHNKEAEAHQQKMEEERVTSKRMREKEKAVAKHTAAVDEERARRRQEARTEAGVESVRKEEAELEKEKQEALQKEQEAKMTEAQENENQMKEVVTEHVAQEQMEIENQLGAEQVSEEERQLQADIQEAHIIHMEGRFAQLREELERETDELAELQHKIAETTPAAVLAKKKKIMATQRSILEAQAYLARGISERNKFQGQYQKVGGEKGTTSVKNMRALQSAKMGGNSAGRVHNAKLPSRFQSQPEELSNVQTRSETDLIAQDKLNQLEHAQIGKGKRERAEKEKEKEEEAAGPERMVDEEQTEPEEVAEEEIESYDLLQQDIESGDQEQMENVAVAIEERARSIGLVMELEHKEFEPAEDYAIRLVKALNKIRKARGVQKKKVNLEQEREEERVLELAN